MEFIIPKKFQIFALEYEVVFDNELAHKNNNIGEASYRLQKIILQPSTKSQPRSDDQIKQTFFHELIHISLHLIGRDDLSDNEQFTDTLAHALYQAIKSSTGELKNSANKGN